MFGRMGQWLQDFLTGYVAQVVTQLSPWLPLIALPWLTVYIAAYGFAVMRGEVSEPFGTFTWKMVKMAAIFAVAWLGGSYMNIVFDTANGIQDGMATVFIKTGFGSAAPGSVWGALDSANDQADKLLQVLWQGADLWRLDLVLASIVFSTGTIVLMVVGAFVTLVAKVFMAFAAAIGPLAILCLMFKQTSKFFDAWLSTLVSAIVLCWFVFFALGLSLFVAQQLLDGIQSSQAFTATSTLSAMRAAATYCIFMVMCALVVYQAPALASSLTGGAAIQTGATAAAAFLAGRGSSAAGAAAGAGGGSVTKGTGLAYGAGQAVGSAGAIGRAAFQRVADRGKR